MDAFRCPSPHQISANEESLGLERLRRPKCGICGKCGNLGDLEFEQSRSCSGKRVPTSSDRCQVYREQEEQDLRNEEREVKQQKKE